VLSRRRVPAFAKTKAERAASKDPRRHWRTLPRRRDYADKMRQAAGKLEQEGYLLPQDAKRIVERAATLTW